MTPLDLKEPDLPDHAERQCASSCLLDAETEVEDAVRRIRLHIQVLHLSDENTQAVVQLGRRAEKDFLLKMHVLPPLYPSLPGVDAALTLHSAEPLQHSFGDTSVTRLLLRLLR